MSTMNEEERRAIEELLPWYAAGTLDRSETRRVDEAIARDPELARKYDLVLEELAGTVEFNESLGAPSSRAMEKLFANIDAEPARRPARAPGIAERFSAFLTSLSPRMLTWAMSAAVLIIVLQAGLLTSALVTGGAGPFQLASGSGDTAANAFAIIRFAPEASAADITRLLEANNVSISTGPVAGGLYRIGTATAGRSEDELAAIIERLRQDRAVSFIAPTE